MQLQLLDTVDIDTLYLGIYINLAFIQSKGIEFCLGRWEDIVLSVYFSIIHINTSLCNKAISIIIASYCGY